MASDLYLVRKNGRFLKYDSVEAVSLTGASEVYSGVTGNDTTDVVTITGALLTNGVQITFQQKTGGTNLSVGTTYYAIDVSGFTCKLASYQGGSALDLGSNITDGYATVQSDEMKVWSSEFRDIFGNTTDLFVKNAIGTPGYAVQTQFEASAAVLPSTYIGGHLTATTLGSYQGGLAVTGTTDLSTSISDEINHYPLRQTFLARTHWKFDMGASVAPRYLYAEWQTGDAVAPNPPNTI